MPPIPPSKQWTLRLKSSHRTILLFADPAQTLISLKENLLSALNEAPPPPDIPPQQLPAAASEIEIGKPIDPFNLAAGFQLMGQDENEAEEDFKPKGKGKARSGGAAESSLKTLGVKDGFALAYRFKNDGNNEDGDEMLGEGTGWSVKVPSYDDAYALDGEQDELPER